MRKNRFTNLGDICLKPTFGVWRWCNEFIHFLAINNLVSFRNIKKAVGCLKMVLVTTHNWITTSDVISDSRYEYHKISIFGLALNLSHFGLFVLGSLNFLQGFGGYGSKSKKCTFVLKCTVNLQINKLRTDRNEL